MNLTQYVEHERQTLNNFGVRDVRGDEDLMRVYGTIYKRIYGWVPGRVKLLDAVKYITRLVKHCDAHAYDFEEYITAQMGAHHSKWMRYPPRLKRVATFKPPMLLGPRAERCYEAHLRLKDDRKDSKLAHLTADFAFARIARINEIVIAETIVGLVRRDLPCAYADVLAVAGIDDAYAGIVKAYDAFPHKQSIAAITVRVARANAIRHAFYMVDPKLPERTQVSPDNDPHWDDFVPILTAAIALAAPHRRAVQYVNLESTYVPCGV